MNRSRINILCPLLLTAAAMLFLCCSDDAARPAELAVKTTLTLTKYHDTSGTSTLPVWQNGDRGVLRIVQSGETAFAAPILAGSQKGFFLFNIAAPQRDVQLISWYPSDAEVTCRDGSITTTLPHRQNGTVEPLLVGQTTARVDTYEGCNMELSPLWCTMYVKVKKGNYSISGAVVAGNNGEMIAGEVSLDPGLETLTASEQRISIILDEPLDCRESGQTIPVLLVPGVLSEGYTVTLTDTRGETFRMCEEKSVTLEAGGRIETGDVGTEHTVRLIFCGDNQACMIDADLAVESGYKNAVLWSWDATDAASTLGIAASHCRVGEGKPVDDNRKLLLTGATGWCVLLDIETQAILFHTTSCPNVHSAELLPNNRVALACSTGDATNNNKVQIYDIATPNRVIAQYPLTSAHGVVWNDSSQRLYAIGGQSLQIYRLKDWESASPALELEKTVTAPQSGLHDLTRINDNTLCLAGRSAYLYDIGTGTFTHMTHFSDYSAIKSLNFDDDTGQAWYTDATVPEGNESWSTHTIRHTSDTAVPGVDKTIIVSDIDVYKVRVINW